MPFYLCHPDDRSAIVANGVMAGDDGYIDLFTDNMVANTIAKDQLFLDRYALFWVTPTGITAAAEPMDAGALTARYQFRVKQSRVDERFVRLMGEHDVIKDRPTAWDYLFWGRRGFKKTDVDEQFQITAALNAGRITVERANAQFAKLSARVNATQPRRRRSKPVDEAGPGESKMVSALKRASSRLERALSAVKNFRELRRIPAKSRMPKRRAGHNPYTDLSK